MNDGSIDFEVETLVVPDTIASFKVFMRNADDQLLQLEEALTEINRTYREYLSYEISDHYAGVTSICFTIKKGIRFFVYENNNTLLGAVLQLSPTFCIQFTTIKEPVMVNDYHAVDTHCKISAHFGQNIVDGKHIKFVEYQHDPSVIGANIFYNEKDNMDKLYILKMEEH